MALGIGAQREEMDGNEASEEQLLDVLYEILAQGVDPTPALRLSDVERFLHEHARQKKSVAELAAFFQAHNLSANPALYAADPELGELASGLHRERGPSSAMFLLDEDPRLPEEIPESPTNRSAVSVAPVQHEDSGVKPRTPVAPPKTSRLKYAVAAAALALVGALAFSLQRGQELDKKLTDARLQQRTTDLALSVLEQRAEGLRGALDQANADRNQLNEKFESFVTDAEKRHAAEDEALKRLLGPRYEALKARELATEH